MESDDREREIRERVRFWTLKDGTVLVAPPGHEPTRTKPGAEPKGIK